VKIESLVSVDAPLVFMSPQARLDAEDLIDILDLGSATVEKETPTLTDLYECFMIRKGKTLIAMILQENACHSYTLVNGDEMRIGTPDLLLHIYYSIQIFGQKTRAFFPPKMECVIQKIHSIGERARASPTAFIPAFGLRCSGRQQGFASLLKEREARREATGKNKKLMDGGSGRSLRQTRKAKSKGRQTRRRL
jgi:hypothetical protein